MILRLLFLALCIVAICLPWLGGVSTPATLIAIGLPHDPPLDSVAIPPLAPLLAEWLLGPSEEVWARPPLCSSRLLSAR